jgi:hypothetical protein
MAYEDFGLLYPSEGGFKTPGAYGAFLQAEGGKKANYLAQMDQFFVGLAENQRQFDATLGFRNKELTSRETLAREGLAAQKEQNTAQFEYNRWMIEQTTGTQKYVANVGANRGEVLTLGGPSASEKWDYQKQQDARRAELMQQYVSGRGGSVPNSGGGSGGGGGVNASREPVYSAAWYDIGLDSTSATSLPGVNLVPDYSRFLDYSSEY